MIIKKFYKKKNILIAGISGFVGYNLALKLSKLGANVTGVYHHRKPQNLIKNIKLKKLDLTNKKSCLLACKKIDYIFMCAAKTSGAKIIEKRPLDHLTPNLIMNTYMLEAAYLTKVKKLCFISSSTVYPEKNRLIKEEDVNYKFFRKYFIVGWMKLFSEKICEMYTYKINRPLNTLIVRPSNLYGPYDKFDWSTAKVIPSLIRKFKEKKFPIEVWGNGDDLKDFLFIDDFIDALLKVFTIKKNIKPINISSGKSVTIKKILELLAKISSNKNVKIKFDPSKPTMIPKRKISNLKIKRLVKWRIKNSLEEGLKKTYFWYEKNS